MKMDIVRATLAYPLIIVIYLVIYAVFLAEDLYPGWSLILFFLSIFLIYVGINELPRRVQKVVRSEYIFIKVSAKLKLEAQALTEPAR
jgi:hypothetical protein